MIRVEQEETCGEILIDSRYNRACRRGSMEIEKTVQRKLQAVMKQSCLRWEILLN